MARLLLLRHGQSTWNAEHRWQGWADPPLSAAGQEQARRAAAWLAAGDERFSALATSDLQRAHQTAAIVGQELGLGPAVVDPALRERDVGDWEGLTTEQIERDWPQVLQDWRAHRIDRTPGGEPAADLVARALAAIERLASRAGGDGPLLVISHGGTIRSLEHHLGATPAPVGNLCGRWVEVSGGAWRTGPRAVLPELLGDAVAAPG